MKIVIHDSIVISEIQKEFSEHFPYLNLRFFGYEQDPDKISAKENIIRDTRKTLGDIRHSRKAGYINLNGNMKVINFEKKFSSFGINAQVCRKSGSQWIQTSSTDNLTLSEQNKTGMASSQHIPEAHYNRDFEDYQEQA